MVMQTKVEYVLEDMRGGEINTIDLATLSNALQLAAEEIGIHIRNASAALSYSIEEE